MDPRGSSQSVLGSSLRKKEAHVVLIITLFTFQESMIFKQPLCNIILYIEGKSLREKH